MKRSYQRRGVLRRSRDTLVAFGRDCAGNVVVLFSLVAPVLLVVAGAAIDYTRNVGAKASLQALADSAALAGAQSMRLANANAQTVSEVVFNFVAAQANGAPISTTTSLTAATSTIAVQLERTVSTMFGKFTGSAGVRLTARAQARNSGGPMPICLLGLEPSQSQSIAVDVARISAPNCQILGDSTATDGVALFNGGQINAGRVCSSGGAIKDSTSSYSPAAQTDCPATADPMAGRAAPVVGACTNNNEKVASGSQTLSPGVYCGGLELKGNANVTLSAGVYVITGGPLSLNGSASLSGTDVTIYLAGDAAKLDLKNGTTLSLSAPATGPMAGILMFEDRAASLLRDHVFETRNAAQMLGTMYFPRGRLKIGTKGGNGSGGTGIGTSSAWTIIVARTLEVTDNQQLTLNTNYSGTTIKPPPGLGNNLGPSPGVVLVQ
jgi:Flp pilus assembly protein TadG